MFETTNQSYWVPYYDHPPCNNVRMIQNHHRAVPYRMDHERMIRHQQLGYGSITGGAVPVSDRSGLDHLVVKLPPNQFKWFTMVGWTWMNNHQWWQMIGSRFIKLGWTIKFIKFMFQFWIILNQPDTGLTSGTWFFATDLFEDRSERASLPPRPPVVETIFVVLKFHLTISTAHLRRGLGGLEGALGLGQHSFQLAAKLKRVEAPFSCWKSQVVTVTQKPKGICWQLFCAANPGC